MAVNQKSLCKKIPTIGSARKTVTFIYRMRKAGNTQQQIATNLGYSQSTISKECGQRGYRSKQAHEISSLSQANKASRSQIISGALETEVIERLKRKHSPDQNQ